MSEDFDWTVTGKDGKGRPVWGVYCRSCGKTTPLPGVEALPRIEQQAELEKAGRRHAVEGCLKQ